jgi:FkbM family methyltransferase
MDTRAGTKFDDPGFSPTGLLLLRTLFHVPPPLREKILFSSSRFSIPLQMLLSRAVGGSRTVRTEFTSGPMRGVVFECSSSEKYFLLGRYFERDLQNALCEIVKPGQVVYDVGANIGYTSLLFSCLGGPQGRVFSFEPSPVNFSRLKRNLELNQNRTVEPLNLAVSSEEGTAFLTERGSQSEIVPKGPGQREQLSCVRTIRLDDFVFRDGNPPPDFIKVDVEGHAGPVLAGMPLLLGRAHPALFIEVHHAEENAQVGRALGGLSYRTAKLDVRDTRDTFPTGILATVPT